MCSIFVCYYRRLKVVVPHPFLVRARKVLTERPGSAGEGRAYFFIIPRSIWATTAYSTPATGQMIQLFAQSFVQKL